MVDFGSVHHGEESGELKGQALYLLVEFLTLTSPGWPPDVSLVRVYGYVLPGGGPREDPGHAEGTTHSLEHLFHFLLRPIAYQPKTCPQSNASRPVDVVETTC